ncbi:hypothetical protein L1887_18055 [Cichorium endivia]|nr:hypothetical protein L1887_18055 [Cichorium endivia]
MAKHKQMMEVETDENKRSKWAQKMDRWNNALIEVAGLKGKDVKGRHEMEFIEEIVKDIHLLNQKKGRRNLLGLALDMRRLEKEKLCASFELKTDVLSNMDSLMLLQLNHVQTNGSYENFPEDLRWLCMHGFPLKSIPSELPMENLVALDMSYSNIESFGIYSNPQRLQKRQKLIGSCSKDKRNLKSRCIMNLEYSAQFTEVKRCRIGLQIEAWGHQYHLPSHHLLTTSQD